MEKELNYLSQTIEKLERIISEFERLAAQQSEYDYALQEAREEKEILENIFNKLTEVELAKH